MARWTAESTDGVVLAMLCYAEFGFFSFLDCITEHEIGAFLMTFRMIALKLARNEYLEYS